MLKGQVFSRQLFQNEIFALFINTFLNGKDGISNDYKNSMAVTASGNNVTIASGAVCIQGRFLEEDTSTTIAAGTENAYCKLVIEIDLDKTNTESDFQQGAYKIIKGANSYPNLTQTDIVKNNAGIYQYELARFRNTAGGITDFEDKRTFLDFDSIYSEIEQHIQDIDEGSLWVQKSNIGVVTGELTLPAASSGTLSTYVDVNYPSGFTKDNCVICSLMSHGNNSTDWATHDGSSGISSAAMFLGNMVNAVLKSSNIRVYGYKALDSQPAQTLTFKIMLMKI